MEINERRVSLTVTQHELLAQVVIPTEYYVPKA